MKEEDIRRYALLMQEMDLSGLEVDEKNQTIRLERSRTTAVEPVRLQPQAYATAGSVSAPVPGGDAAATARPGAEQNFPGGTASAGSYVSVRSPMVGTFYLAPAEDAQPYVRIGEKVQKGTTLCIIEAMKLMNEIPAEESGTILEVCVSNGQMVEYGTELFRIGKGS